MSRAFSVRSFPAIIAAVLVAIVASSVGASAGVNWPSTAEFYFEPTQTRGVNMRLETDLDHVLPPFTAVYRADVCESGGAVVGGYANVPADRLPGVASGTPGRFACVTDRWWDRVATHEIAHLWQPLVRDAYSTHLVQGVQFRELLADCTEIIFGGTSLSYLSQIPAGQTFCDSTDLDEVVASRMRMNAPKAAFTLKGDAGSGSVEFDVEGQAIGSVEFWIDGEHIQTESFPPYSIFGDAGGVANKAALDGRHLTATAYTGPRGQGDVITTESFFLFGWTQINQPLAPESVTSTTAPVDSTIATPTAEVSNEQEIEFTFWGEQFDGAPGVDIYVDSQRVRSLRVSSSAQDPLRVVVKAGKSQTIELRFTHDKYDGPGRDRNLYLDSFRVDGQPGIAVAEFDGCVWGGPTGSGAKFACGGDRLTLRNMSIR